MQNKTMFFLVCGFGLFFVCSCTEKESHKDKPLTIYDTALLMLHEFVAESNDTLLGFSNANEVLKAHIAVDSGIEMYILGKGKLLENYHPQDSTTKLQDQALRSEMNKLSRKIYPVYVGNVLHSAITFDSTHAGWRPVMFDAGNVLAPYIAELLKPSAPIGGIVRYGILIAPMLQDQLIIKHDTSGDYIIPTKELRRRMAENYPGSKDTNDLSPVKQDEFFEGLKRHMKKFQIRPSRQSINVR